MSLTPINRDPSARDLFYFGALLPLFFFGLGLVFRWRFGLSTAGTTCWVLGGTVWGLYLCVPRIRKPVYTGWQAAFWPVSWALSHVLLAVVFYLAVTPVGWVRRRIGLDPMGRRLDKASATYWHPRHPPERSERYFEQF
ncbi:MAG: hypothetical protein GC164_03035 [Phycisphaera sp.]|nr:hypothetical protein [Phycisphaera sp.]